MSDAATTEVQAPFAPSDISEYQALAATTYAKREVTLPSGLRAIVAKPNTFFLASTGQVPEKVKAAETAREKTKTAAAKAAAEAAAKADAEATDSEIMEAIGSSASSLAAIDVLAEFLVAKSFVKPRVSLVPMPDRLWIGDVIADDKQYLIDLLQIEL